MANEKRLIDANAIPWEEHYVPDGDVQWEYKKELCVLKPTIDAMPTVDAVEVVRCGKCQYFNKRGYEEDNRQQGIPELDSGWCPILYRTMQACNFCSYGERREGE